MIRFPKAIVVLALVCGLSLGGTIVFADEGRQDGKLGELDNMKIGVNEEGDSVMEIGPRPDIDMTPRDEVPIVVQPYIGNYPPRPFPPIPGPGPGPVVRPNE
ncbi:hypothetical protein [Desulfovibrio inopinatus]|uniref:hypothetical protein n=1 Tax=Desulfovibrio inopinatus TaxID=102109 RepID=UPI00041649BB|nr:hypothetical protein [Desulfovibrio inopinatus]